MAPDPALILWGQQAARVTLGLPRLVAKSVRSETGPESSHNMGFNPCIRYGDKIPSAGQFIALDSFPATYGLVCTSNSLCNTLTSIVSLHCNFREP